MFPSGSSGSSFGLVPGFIPNGENGADDARGSAFTWLNQFGGGGISGSGIGGGSSSSRMYADQLIGMKMAADQTMERSNVNLDQHTPSMPRLTPHSTGSTNSTGGGQQQLRDSPLVGAFPSYSHMNNGFLGIDQSPYASSQLAMYDAMYKACGANSFGSQAFSPLLAEHQLMLQASMLQYPHLSLYANPSSLYPGLSASARYANEYQAPGMHGMPSGYSTSPSGWLDLESYAYRTMSGSGSKRESKDPDRKPDQEPSKRHDEMSDQSAHRLHGSERLHSLERLHSSERLHGSERPHGSEMHWSETRPDYREKNEHARQASERDFMKKEHQRRSGSYKSPSRTDSRGTSEINYDLLQGSLLPGDQLMRSAGVSPFQSFSEQNVNRPSSSDVEMSFRMNPNNRRDKIMDPAQETLKVREKHQSKPNKTNEFRSQTNPMLASAMKQACPAGMTKSQEYERKFHRPFEQATNLPSGKESDRQRSDHATSSGRSFSTMPERNNPPPSREATDQRSVHGEREHQHHRHSNTATSSDAHARRQHHRASATQRDEEYPLNLVVSKGKPARDSNELMRRDANFAPDSSRLHQSVRQNLPSSGSSRRGEVTSVPSALEIDRRIQTPSISKLDLEMERNKKRKLITKSSDNDDCDDNDEKELAKLLLIVNGPPLKESISARKINCLSHVGLLPVERCKGLQFELRRKRKRLLRQPSLSPTELECNTEPFIENLGLPSKLDPSGVATPSTNLPHFSSTPNRGGAAAGHAYFKDTHGSMPSLKLDPDNMQFQDISGTLDAKPTTDIHTFSDISQINGCLSSSRPASPRFQQSNDHTQQPSNRRNHQYAWPGLEVALVSHYNYAQDQSAEKQVLAENGTRLSKVKDGLLRQTDRLGTHLSELKRTRQKLREERQSLQTAIDNLKSCLKLKL